MRIMCAYYVHKYEHKYTRQAPHLYCDLECMSETIYGLCWLLQHYNLAVITDTTNNFILTFFLNITQHSSIRPLIFHYMPWPKGTKPSFLDATVRVYYI